MRIEVCAAKRFPSISRTVWQKNGQFFRNDLALPGKTKGREGETWTVVCDETNRSHFCDRLDPWDTPLTILQESDTWLVIDKPAGVSVHPSRSEQTQQTIVHALVHHFGDRLSHIPQRDPESGANIIRPGLVHRLDKGTSGVLLIAKTDATHRYLQAHWKTVIKAYSALVETSPEKILPSRGKIEAGIARDRTNRQRMAVSKDAFAREAETYFDLVASFPEQHLSQLHIQIPTGRTHQIRVHLSAIGFPIHGDTKYGGSPADRMYLHAQSIAFPNPDQGGQLTTVQSPIPTLFRW